MRHSIRGAAFAVIVASACGKDGPSGPTGEGVHVLVRPDTVSLVDAAVAAAPSVVVLDAANHGRTGLAVTFTVVAGGGSVSDSVVTTDASGHATLTSWTLGPTPTENVLVIAVPGEAPESVTVTGRWPHRLATAALGACAIVAAKSYCWGDNSHREFGIVLTFPSSSPVLAVSQIQSSGLDEIYGSYGHHFCATTESDFGVCWGRNDFGQAASITPKLTGVFVTPLWGHEWRQISPARITTCGLDSFQQAYCWGANQRGEIGNAATRTSFSAGIEAPTQVIASVKFKQVSAGWQHACAIALDGTAYCWGANLDGQLGIGVADSIQPTATAVSTTEKFKMIAAGGRHTCGITTDGRAFCWGQNAYGQLGDSTVTSRLTPVGVAGGLRFTSIAVGTFFVSALPPELSTAPLAGTAEHTCALTAAGRAWCWGWNGWGQLGDGTLIDRSAPVAVAGSLTFSGLSLGESSACAMRGAKAWCWGGNANFQLGDASNTRRLQPVQVLLPAVP